MGRLLGIKKELWVKVLGKGSISKVIRYFKKNGFMNTVYASIERVFFAYHKNYTYSLPEEEKLASQRAHIFSEKVLISIVVPTYETNENHLKEMIESVLFQTYEDWELILADASNSEKVKKVADTYTDKRIVYKKLEKNSGISDNTNEGILLAKGDYIALLDHDDMLTVDALYEVMSVIEKEKKEGKLAKVIFSDEDKCNSDGSRFFEPHFKPGYNKELLFTNNYICHFFVCKAELMKELLLRKEFDGAQDFDLVLRATSYVNKEQNIGGMVSICHIPKVLYHWRCHENSTAQNPESKMYAYEAGKRAVQSALDGLGRKLTVVHGKHLGFYQPEIENLGQLFEMNEKLGCIGGAVYRGNKVIGGAMDKEGKVLYSGLHKKFEGYMNRAHLMQTAVAVDIRNILVREELRPVYDEFIKTCDEKKQLDYVKLSLEFCEKIGKMGYEILYWER